jgi:hypothetical protein
MIHIEKLSPRQIAIAEILWTCRDEDELKDTIMAMPTHQDRVDASSLIKLMMWDTIEQEQGLGDYADATDRAIACAMR